jgi:tetratricopeptide (TPR) repeat protein
MPSRDRHPNRLLATALCSATLSLLLAPAARSAAQDEPEFVNLQVLAKDIAREELMDVMRFDFVGGLGVRCNYCHVGEEETAIDEYDFASDAKAPKRKAREMLRMVRAINDTHLAALEDRAEPPIRVSCFTCHHGVTEPRKLQDILFEELREGGPDATVARYRELREEYHGRAAYDFGPTVLSHIAIVLGEEDRQAEAIPLLELNVEQHPEFWYSYVLLGDYLTEADRPRAIRHFERALELAPEGSKVFVEQRLDALRAPEAPGSP